MYDYCLEEAKERFDRNIADACAAVGHPGFAETHCVGNSILFRKLVCLQCDEEVATFTWMKHTTECGLEQDDILDEEAREPRVFPITWVEDRNIWLSQDLYNVTPKEKYE